VYKALRNNVQEVAVKVLTHGCDEVLTTLSAVLLAHSHDMQYGHPDMQCLISPNTYCIIAATVHFLLHRAT
jgi:hypothetical protein